MRDLVKRILQVVNEAQHGHAEVARMTVAALAGARLNMRFAPPSGGLDKISRR